MLRDKHTNGQTITTIIIIVVAPAYTAWVTNCWSSPKPEQVQRLC